MLGISTFDLEHNRLFYGVQVRRGSADTPWIYGVDVLTGSLMPPIFYGYGDIRTYISPITIDLIKLMINCRIEYDPTEEQILINAAIAGDNSTLVFLLVSVSYTSTNPSQIGK